MASTLRPSLGIDGGQFVTSRQIEERLDRELLATSALRVEQTEAAEAFKVSGRGELQLAILIEMMRREGYEVPGRQARGHHEKRRENGALLEPLELVVIDVPEEFIGVVTEARPAKGPDDARCINNGSGRVRLELRDARRAG